MATALLAVSDVGAWGVCLAAFATHEGVATWAKKERLGKPFYVIPVSEFPLPESHTLFTDATYRYWTGTEFDTQKWRTGEVMEIPKVYHYRY